MTMDYRPDWPPTPRPARRRRPLWQRMLIWTAVYAAITVLGLALISVRDSAPLDFGSPDGPTTYATTVLPSSPAATHGHPGKPR